MAVRRKRYTRAEKMLLLRVVESVQKMQRNQLDELLKFVIGIKQNLYLEKGVDFEKEKTCSLGSNTDNKR